MEWIAQNGKRDIMTFQKFQKPPEVRMEDRISSRNIKIRQSVICPAKIKTIVKCFLHLFPRHGIQLFAVVL